MSETTKESAAGEAAEEIKETTGATRRKGAVAATVHRVADGMSHGVVVAMFALVVGVAIGAAGMYAFERCSYGRYDDGFGRGLHMMEDGRNYRDGRMMRMDGGWQDTGYGATIIYR